MDRKSILILVLSLGLLFLISPLVDRLFPPKALPPRPVAIQTNQLSSTSAPPNLSAARPEASAASNAAVASPTARPEIASTAPEVPEKILTVSVDEFSIFHFTSHGGGLKSVELKKYPAAIDCSRKLPAESKLASLNTRAPVPVMALVGGGSELQGDNVYTLSQRGNVVTAEKTLPNGLRLVKEFNLNVGTNYLMTAKLRVENTSSKPLTLPAREVVMGAASQMSPTDDPTATGSYWYNGQKAEEVKDAWFANRTLVFFSGTPRLEYQGGASNVVWAAVHNQFFTLAAIPQLPASQVVIKPIQLPAPEAVPGLDTSHLTNGLQAAFGYPSAVLSPNQSIESTYTIYAGPKEYRFLAKIGQHMNNNLDLIMGFSGFFGFFSKFLLLAMNALHGIGLTYGLAIIGITVIIKAIFWPLTNASTKSMKRMQLLQPQLKAIAEKYKDDPAKKNQKTMAYMKEHKVNPLGGCLPMLLQIPVFFGFYWMLRNSIELRGVPFLWACDLSQSDTVAHLAGFPINPMPLIMGVTMLWQAQLTPVSPGMDPGQQKIMKYMPLMFIVILYKMSAGLTLYWTVQNLLTILQTKLTKTSDGPAAPGGKSTPVIAPKKK